MPTLKLLPLGDSLTAGSEASATGYRSWRGPLQKQLADNGYSVDFVGTQQSTPAIGGTDPDHDGYGGARMDSSDSPSNSIEGRIAAIRAAVGPVDIIVVPIGWNDVYQATASIGTKHGDLMDAIQAGDWASANIVMATLAPEPNKTPAQTGSDYPEYAALNAAVLAGVTSSRIVADWAGLTTSSTADRDAMVEKLLLDASLPPEVTVDANGNDLQAKWGGHFITSFKSIQDFNANWRTNVAERRGMNSFTTGLAPSPSIIGHPTFVNSVRAIAPWLWIYAGQGHASSNTVVEARNLFAEAERLSTAEWAFFFQGARLGITDQNSAVYGSHPQVLRGFRSDGITSYFRTGGSASIETWAEDTVPSRGIVRFHGGFDRSLMADAAAFFVGLQVRLALLDPSGTNDIAQSRFVVKCGFDAFVGGQAYRYDYWGWPLDCMDGGSDRWQILRATDWTPIGAVPMDRGSGHFEDPAAPPPHSFDYSEGAHTYNDYPTYSKSAAQIRANPPRLPQYWTARQSTGNTSAWTPADYWFNPSLGALDIHWSSQGAEKAARVIYDAMLRAGWLDGGGGGEEPVISSPLPGVSSFASWLDRWADESTDPDTANWRGLDESTASVAPSWSTTTLPPATVGGTYSGQLVANGEPAPTYSIVSGAPGWLACSSSGALSNSGAITGDDATYLVTFEASNGVSPDAQITLELRVVAGVVITTTSLPSGEDGVAYYQPLSVTGAGPFTWSVPSGAAALEALGLSLSAAGGVVLGATPIAGSATFTVRATGFGGAYDEQVLSITVGDAGDAPVIVTTSLPDADVDEPYTATIEATGAEPYLFEVIAGAPPPGIEIDPETGDAIGTPTVPGGYPFTVRLSNGFEPPAVRQFSIRVVAVASSASPSPWSAVLKGR